LTTEYTHELDEEVRTISGWYMLERDGIIEIDGKEILFAVGNAAVDSSCCGSWGCYYAVVPGYVVDWKYKKNDKGLAVSAVEPVRDDGAKQRISALLEHRERVDQVCFW
jgi:hypothetical protein